MAAHDEPIRSIDTWTVEDLEALAATQCGRVLEQIREFAQFHAYRSEEPKHVRLRWAKLSLLANRRLRGDDPWNQARTAQQAFALRIWIIGHLGPDTDPDWNPETLAADTLAALALDSAEAGTLSVGWPDLPIEQIGELRRHKNMTAHLDRLLALLQPSPTTDQLVAWQEVRKHLP
ncbi:hypothetical protein [Kitasatospora sp. NPDC002040]|uniref:hypothetical protein n=1 Tax=Kitasatospora sp. NPDC002040 TaxID=3154661 RepID=UPI00332BB8FE